METREATTLPSSSVRPAIESSDDVAGVISYGSTNFAAASNASIASASNARIRFWTMLLSDAAVIVCIFFLAVGFSAITREFLGVPPLANILPSSTLLAFAIFGLPVILILGKSFFAGHYNQPKPAWSEVRDLLKIGAYSFALVSIILFLSKTHFSRLLFGSFWLFLLIALPFSRHITKRALIRFSKWFVPLAIVGSGKNGKRCIESIQADEMLGYAAFRSDENQNKNHTKCATLFAPDCVDEFEKTFDRIESTLRSRSSIILSTPMFGLSLRNAEMLELPQHDSALIRIHNNLRKPHHMMVKRCFDVIASALALILIAPVMLILYYFVTRDSGPFLYKQRRFGKDGQIFNCWKIRSMVTDSSARMERYLQENPGAKEEWETSFKLKNDPRITRTGKFIRKWSLDELPQLWNVLIGDMSLVGPRPILLEEKNSYGGGFNYYKDSRPGITGLWQISGRNDTSYSERVDMVVSYSRNWSLWLDIVIILKTIPILFGRSGAY